MHEALAAERDEIRLFLAPAAQCSRPLTGAFRVECLAARTDHRAVGDAGDDRVYLALDDREHHVFELRNALGDAAQSDQALSDADSRHRRGAGLAAPARDLRGLSEPVVRRVGRSRLQERNGLQAARQNLGRAVAIVVLQQLLGPGVPAARQHPFTSEAEVHRGVAGTFGGTGEVALARPGPTGSGQPVDIRLVVTGQQRGTSELFEIVRLKNDLRRGQRIGLTGVAPGAGVIRLARDR